MALVDSANAAPTAVARGATILQLRLPGAGGRAYEKEGRAVIPTAIVPVLLSSRADVALAVGAAGVHLPESDLPVADARRLLGRERLIGRSVHSREAALAAAAEGADYLVFGPVFETPSHAGRPAVGLEALRDVCRAVSVPVLAIGGVDFDRAEECHRAGASGFAGISAFR
ncbi:MAG: thiamine phosphate synthase [Chloroflexi bacterium]|nr:MAG: thiamine phosphate synthase [Chloroflexota bacterium]